MMLKRLQHSSVRWLLDMMLMALANQVESMFLSCRCFYAPKLAGESEVMICCLLVQPYVIFSLFSFSLFLALSCTRLCQAVPVVWTWQVHSPGHRPTGVYLLESA